MMSAPITNKAWTIQPKPKPALNSAVRELFFDRIDRDVGTNAGGDSRRGHHLVHPSLTHPV
jgi:hypothetical protein